MEILLRYMPLHNFPSIITNLQVSVGGQNVLQSTLQYTYEHFLEQVNLCEQLTSSDFGISTGLINQNYWENSKWYYVNVERGNAADKLMAVILMYLLLITLTFQLK